MNAPSRRKLASYTADQLLLGKPVKTIARDLASSLSATGRKKEIDLLINDVAWELENRGVSSHATVTSAHPLTPKLRAEIEKFIKTMSKVSKVDLEESIDKSVLGGVRIETPTHLWDKTAVKSLAQLKEAI